MTSLWNEVERRGFVEILAVGHYDWDWSEFKAWKAPSGRLYWFADSGCSCTAYGDGFTSAADLGDGDRDALERAFRAWADGGYLAPSPGDVTEGIAAIRRL